MNIEPDFPNKLFIPHSLTLSFKPVITCIVSHQSLLKLNPSISAFLQIPKIPSSLLSHFGFFSALRTQGDPATPGRWPCATWHSEERMNARKQTLRYTSWTWSDPWLASLTSLYFFRSNVLELDPWPDGIRVNR